MPPPESASSEKAQPATAEPVLLPPRGLWAVALGLFALTAAAAVLWAPPLRPTLLPDFALDHWRDVDLAAMRQHDDALMAAPVTDPGRLELEARIAAQFTDYLQREALLGDQVGEEAAARATLGQLEEAVRMLVQRWGADALRRLAVAWGRRVRTAAETALVTSRAAHQPLASRLQAVPLPADVSDLTALAGALGAVLARMGMDQQVEAGAVVPAAGQVVEALAQARFLQLGVRVPGGAPQLASDAWFLVLHFRVEAHPGMALERRLALLDELAAAEPAYPADYIRGVWLAREQRYAQAEAAFTRAAATGEYAAKAAKNRRWCRERIHRAASDAAAAQPAPER